MNLRVKLLFLFCLVFALSLKSKNVVIKGTAEGFAGKEIEVLKYDDYVTHIQERISIAFVDKEEKFSINLNVKHTEYVQLKIEDKTTGLYVEPGKVYNIYLWYDKVANAGHIYDRELSVSFPYPKAGSINQLISLTNIKLDKYITDNKPYIMKQDKRRMANSFFKFKKEILNNEALNSKQYIKDYVLYSIASMQTALDIIPTEDQEKKVKNADTYLFDNYLKNKPVLFDNQAYMNFFAQIFNGRFLSMRLKKGIIINGAITMGWNYKKMASYLKEKAVFSNDTLLELFFLTGIDNNYHQKYVHKGNMLKILKEIENNPVCEETKELAENVHRHITDYELPQGKKAPDFTLPDVNNKMISLKDFRGKYVYLEFWAPWSISSVREMTVIKNYKKKYGDKIAFISICTDGDLSTMRSFLKIYHFDWTFLHYNYNNDLLSSYFVYNIPTYILIDSKGEIVAAPAPQPAGNIMHPGDSDIEKMFYAIMNGNKL